MSLEVTREVLWSEVPPATYQLLEMIGSLHADDLACSKMIHVLCLWKVV